MSESWTVRSILEWTTEFFNKKDIKEARLDAEVLLASVLNCKRLELNLMLDNVLPQNVLNRYRGHVKNRQQRKPVSYILGKHEFMGLHFHVNTHTLIPRPETELLVEEALELIKKNNCKILADIGTGCGNIAVSIAKLSDVEAIYATDVSIEALKVCWKNIHFHAQAARVIPKQGDLTQALERESLEGRLDMMVSNPPYVALDEFSGFEPELNFEPRLALEGGQDGLELYRRLLKEAKVYLKPSGSIVLEMNANKSSQIKALLEQNGYNVEKIKKDYAGLDRVLVGVRS